ncbi:MAG: adenylate kinase [Caldilineaceae bacterium]|nr:adenylate kinase [Caldilineaceae bacterium]
MAVVQRRTYLVLLGIPGAGKGTQAKLLEEKLNLPQISTGDIFRYNMKNQTELGKLAKSYMDRGDLVPDEVTIRMVEDRLQQPDCVRGALMDGFPRNLVQVTAFDKIVAPYGGVTLTPLINLDDDEAMKRITGRRICRTCGAVYHVDFHPPKQSGICDLDQGELYQRADDAPETVRNRLYVYYKQTAPLIGYYYAKSLLRELDGAQPIEAVQAQLVQLIAKALQQ